MAAARIQYLDPADRVSEAWATLRQLRSQRRDLDELIVAAEARWDAEMQASGTDVRPTLLSIPDAAKRLGVSESKLWKAQKAGTLVCTKIGRLTRVSEMQLAAFVESEG